MWSGDHVDSGIVGEVAFGGRRKASKTLVTSEKQRVVFSSLGLKPVA